MTGTAAADATAILARLDGTPLVVLLDVDGTLAPIALRPEDAAVPAETRAVVAGLARLPDARVALVSGRRAADALRMVGVAGLAAAGNHGFEMVGADGRAHAHPSAAPFLPALADALADLRAAIGAIPGVRVEDKGPTATVHYRLVDAALVPEVRAVTERVAAVRGLHTAAGKEVLELRPPVAVDKGTAVLGLVDAFGGNRAGASLLFAGDDVTDEDAFRALRRTHPRATTIHVGERPDTAAEFAVVDPPALRVVLEALLRARGG